MPGTSSISTSANPLKPWEKRKQSTVAVDDLLSRFKFEEMRDSAVARLPALIAAAAKDGRINAQMISDYVNQPNGLVMSSKAIKESIENLGTGKKLSGFPTRQDGLGGYLKGQIQAIVGDKKIPVSRFSGVKGDFYQWVDHSAGNKDNVVDPDELLEGIKKVLANEGCVIASTPCWGPDQWEAQQEARIVSPTDNPKRDDGPALNQKLGTKELDPLRVIPKAQRSDTDFKPLKKRDDFNGVVVGFDYARAYYSAGLRTPDVVSYVITADDKRFTDPILDRVATFSSDPQQQPLLGQPPVTDAEFLNTLEAQTNKKIQIHRGHLKEFLSSPNKEAAREGNRLSLVTRQHGPFNELLWNFYESGISELVMATGGRATIHTLVLYLDGAGKPIPRNKIAFHATNGRELSEPTHLAKTVLLEMPDGKKQMFAYMFENKADYPENLPDSIPIFQKGRISVEKLQELSGYDLYADLKKSDAAKLERDTDTRLDFERDRAKYKFASQLWK